MARDYLAIQGSSVASERAFSSAAISDDLRHNKTETKAFGNLQVLKFAYKTNFLDASDEAALLCIRIILVASFIYNIVRFACLNRFWN